MGIDLVQSENDGESFRITVISANVRHIKGILKVGHNGALHVVYWDSSDVCDGKLKYIKNNKDSRTTNNLDWSAAVEIIDGVEKQQPGLVVTPSGVLFVSYIVHDWAADTDTLVIYKSTDEGDNWSKVSETVVA